MKFETVEEWMKRTNSFINRYPPGYQLISDQERYRGMGQVRWNTSKDRKKKYQEINECLKQKK